MAIRTAALDDGVTVLHAIVLDYFAQARRADGPCLHVHCLAITTRRDPFPRVSVTAARAADVIGVAMVHLYALHGVRVSRLQVVVERWPFTMPPGNWTTDTGGPVQ